MYMQVVFGEDVPQVAVVEVTSHNEVGTRVDQGGQSADDIVQCPRYCYVICPQWNINSRFTALNYLG